MSSIISIKDFKSGLPTLVGKSNFRSWYNSWYVSLRGAGLWPYVCDDERKKTRPTSVPLGSKNTLAEEREKYDMNNDAAHALLLCAVCTELQDTVSSVAYDPESACVAMKLLKNKYDHETTTSTLALFSEFFDMKMNEGADLSSHLSNFEIAYQHILSRCNQSKRTEAKALKDFLSVEEVRIMCLFRSLPSSFANIIDNLSTKDHLSYDDINAHLQDLLQEE